MKNVRQGSFACKRCDVMVTRTSNSQRFCAACAAAVIRERNRDRMRQDPEANRARVKAWAIANPERARDGHARKRKQNPELYDAMQRRYRERRDPEAKKEAWRRGSRQRRANLRQVPSESYTTRAVFERDDWTCRLCEKRIDPILVWPDSGSATVDHVVPISWGGPDTFENAQAAHMGCNARKGARRKTA